MMEKIEEYIERIEEGGGWKNRGIGKGKGWKIREDEEGQRLEEYRGRERLEEERG